MDTWNPLYQRKTRFPSRQMRQLMLQQMVLAFYLEMAQAHPRPRRLSYHHLSRHLLYQPRLWAVQRTIQQLR